MNELQKHEPSELDQKQAHPPATIYEALHAMARDITIPVERIAGLMDLQIKAEDRHAEKEFNAALARAISKMPRISRDGKNTGPAGWKFTTIDNLDRVIRPIYTAEGFSLSFISEPTDNGITRVAILRHNAGHSQESRLKLPADTGPGRNVLQALGSSLSYADRYLTRGIFNIISGGEDDDATGISPISEKQRDGIEDLINELGQQVLPPFLAFMGVKAVGDIQKGGYAAAISYLVAIRHKREAKEK